MGVEALLQSAFDGADMEERNDIRKDDILQNVLSMEPEDRAPLWDGVFFVTFSDVSATVEELLRELNCPNSHIIQFERNQELLEDIHTFVRDERNQPELKKRRQSFVRAYMKVTQNKAKQRRSQGKKAKDNAAAMTETLHKGQ
jgi:hypothetical protein